MSISQKLHSYAASFGHDLAKDLLSDLKSKRGAVLDPFVGSGTTLFEALASGYEAIGIDTDPIALLITKTLTLKLSENWFNRFEKKVQRELQDFEVLLGKTRPDGRLVKAGFSFTIGSLQVQIPMIPELDFWFSAYQKIVLGTLVAYSKTLSRNERIIFQTSISSSIIRKWPNTISKAMDIDHSRPHKRPVIGDSIARNFLVFNKVFKKNLRTLKALSATTDKWKDSARILAGDSVSVMRQMKSGSVSAVLTSPPYVNAIDYPRAHKFSEWWLFSEHSQCKRSNYIGLRTLKGKNADVEEIQRALAQSLPKERSLIAKLGPRNSSLLYQYILDMKQVVAQSYRLIKKDGELVFVIADNRLEGVVVPVVKILAWLLRDAGFDNVRITWREIKRTRRRYPFEFGGVMTREAIIKAQKSVPLP